MKGSARLSPRQIREVAHELRAPLGGISAMIELISRTPLSAEQRRFVAALRASAEHLHTVCSRALGSGAEPSEPAAMLGDCLEPVAFAAAARAAARGLGFRLVLPPEIRDRRVEAPAALRQVLENLIDNAVRLTEAGEIALAAEAAGDSRLAFAVSDSGPGLSAAEAERLISRGGKIEGRPGGAGLGLSISGRLVGERGGRLSGGPGPDGRGTRFGFDWPAADHIKARDAIADCLVVDDHPASRQVTAAILGALALSCDEAEGVDAAIARQAAGGHRLVLTDLQMPEGGGERLIRHFSALPAARRPRIVVISADPVPADSPVAGMIAAEIAKPISVTALAEALRRCGVLEAGESKAA